MIVDGIQLTHIMVHWIPSSIVNEYIQHHLPYKHLHTPLKCRSPIKWLT